MSFSQSAVFDLYGLKSRLLEMANDLQHQQASYEGIYDLLVDSEEDVAVVIRKIEALPRFPIRLYTERRGAAVGTELFVKKLFSRSVSSDHNFHFIDAKVQHLADFTLEIHEMSDSLTLPIKPLNSRGISVIVVDSLKNGEQWKKISESINFRLSSPRPSSLHQEPNEFSPREMSKSGSSSTSSRVTSEPTDSIGPLPSSPHSIHSGGDLAVSGASSTSCSTNTPRRHRTRRRRNSGTSSHSYHSSTTSPRYENYTFIFGRSLTPITEVEEHNSSEMERVNVLVQRLFKCK